MRRASSGPVLSVLCSVFPTPWCLSPARGLGPPALLGGCAGHGEAGREPGSLCLPLAPAEAGALGSLRAVPVRGPAMRLSVLGCVRCGGWRVWTRSLTRLVSRTVSRSTGDSAGAPGLFRVDADTSPCGSEDATPSSRACVRVLVTPGRVGRAGLPGAFWCASPFLLAALSFRFAGPPPGWGCPCFGPLFALTSPLLLLVCWFLFSRLFVLPCAPSVSCFSWSPAPGALGLGALRCLFCWPRASWLPVRSRFLVLPCLGPISGGCPPAPFSCCCCRSLLHCACFFFFPFSPLVRAPLVAGFLCFPAPGARGLGTGLSLLCPAFRARFFFSFSFFCLPPPGSSCALACFVPPGWPVVVPRWLLPSPPPLLCRAAFVVFFLLFCPPPLSLAFSGPRPVVPVGLGALFCLFLLASRCPALRALSPRVCLPLGRWLLPGGSPPPPPLLCLSVFVAPARCLGSSSVRPRCLRLSLVSGPRCPGPRRCALFALLACCFLALRALSPLSCFPPGHWLLLGGCPPLPFVSRGFRRCRSVLCAVCCTVLCVPGCVAAPRCCALGRPVLCCRVLCGFVALVWCSCLLRRALWRCTSPWGPVLCGAVLCGVPTRCVLCAACILSWRGGACCCWPLCSVLRVSWGAVLCVPCPLRSVRCCASLCWCACVVLFVWCLLLLAPGAVVHCCVLCCSLSCAVVRCWVWWPVVVCWWRVSVSVSLSGRVVCFPVVGVVCCGALLPCGVFCGAVLSRGAVLLCSAVVLWCCLGLLCPPVACRAVLCCAVGWLCCSLPSGGFCVLWFSFPRAVRSLFSPLCALRCLVVLAVVPCFPVSCAVALC